MELGNCRLCGQRKNLVESHVWPAFAYKRYAADVAQGGKFLNLHTERLSNAQFKRPWFCAECDNETLGRYENYAGGLCATLDQRPDDPHAYDERLLPFVTSISWRSAMHDDRPEVANDGGRLRMALRHWRQYLLGKKRRVEPFTQHLFVVYPTDCDMHKALGGQVFPNKGKGLVLSQIGPLFIIGLLGHANLSLQDLRIWERSRVRPEGGEVQGVQEWRVGSQVTLEFMLLLCKHDYLIKKKVVSLFGPGGSARKGASLGPRSRPTS